MSSAVTCLLNFEGTRRSVILQNILLLGLADQVFEVGMSPGDAPFNGAPPVNRFGQCRF